MKETGLLITKNFKEVKNPGYQIGLCRCLGWQVASSVKLCFHLIFGDNQKFATTYSDRTWCIGGLYLRLHLELHFGMGTKINKNRSKHFQSIPIVC